MLTGWLPRVVDQTVHDSSGFWWHRGSEHHERLDGPPAQYTWDHLGRWRQGYSCSPLGLLQADKVVGSSTSSEVSSRSSPSFSTRFSVRLFCFAYTNMCSSSWATKWEFTDGTIKYESSAYLLSSSKSCNTLKSLALMTYAKGPIPEPWTMLALMSKNMDVFPLNLVQCCLSSRKSKSQLCAKSWIGNLALFSRSVECRTISNALKKIQGQEVNIWILLEELGQPVSQIYQCACGWSGGPEGVLVFEQMTASWVVEYWVKTILHHNRFHYSGQDGGDWYWSVFSTRLRICYFRKPV